MGTEVEGGATMEHKDAAQNELVKYEHDIEKGARANIFCGKIIGKLDQVPREFRKNHIFKVDDVTRKGHENHYEPILFAIGPYHRGKSNLQSMEEHKWQCLNRMIERATNRTGETRCDLIKRSYEVLEGLEDEARGYYAEDTTGLDSSEFLEMLLLDGCFLVNTLCTNLFYYGDDPLINQVPNNDIRQHDILLLENQLPFFILQKLHDVMVTDDGDENGSSLLLLSSIKSPFVHCSMIKPIARHFHDYMNILVCVSKHFGKVEDLLDEYPEGMMQYISDLAVQEKGREVDPEKLKNTKHLLELMYKVLLCEDRLEIPVATSTAIQMVSQDEFSLNDFLNVAFYNTYSVTELSNAGVKFKSVDKQKFYDIQFKNGTLKIPTINININETEGMLRNLMAYEIGADDDKWILNDYVTFMDSIISSGKDVELLRIHGIIEHYLGDDEAVSTMFSKLGAITERSAQYYYSDIVRHLKHHCKKRQNVWMAKLRSDYFSSPWTIISVIAAFVLLVLTVIQTVYSPLSYYKG